MRIPRVAGEARVKVWRLVGGVFFVILRPIERLPHTAARHAAQRQLKPGFSENQRNPHLVFLREASSFRKR